MTSNAAVPTHPSTLELRAQMLTSSNALRAHSINSTNTPSLTASPIYQDGFRYDLNILMASLDLLDATGNLRG